MLLDPDYAPDETKDDSEAVARLRRPVSDGETLRAILQVS